LEIEPDGAGAQPYGAAMTYSRRQWRRRPRLCGFAILALLTLALPITPKANATFVSVYGYSLY
jgi:hypothetical protein